MCDIAKTSVPSATIIHAHFLRYDFKTSFDVIYSIGVLIYFSKTQINAFFDKLYLLLTKNGKAFISYPHAFRSQDLQYRDYTYVHYSPLYLESLLKEKFIILYHMHQDGSRKIEDFDHTPKTMSGSYDGRTYYNSSILIIQKKR